MATMLNAEITGLHPSKLWIIRWACKLAGCKVKAWTARSRKQKKLEENAA